MTPTEMETLVQNLDARWARIEQILPTLATRDDLARFERGLRTELTEQIAASAQAVRTDLTGLIHAVRAELTEDMHSSALALRADFTEQISSSANGLRGLIEASRDETRVLAEHVLDLVTRFPRRP